MFDVNEHTCEIVLLDEMTHTNFEQARAAVAAGLMEDHGIQDFGTEAFDPGAIRCSCGRTVELMTDWQGTRCACGHEYGSDGQQFRATWRDYCRETGEVTDDDFL